MKMVHNGIEYGLMQLIAEAYDLMHRGLKTSPRELGAMFAGWSRGELESYLIEITAEILSRIDEDTGLPLVDVILDQAGHKGTGTWTTQEALDQAVPIPTITAAVDARLLSAYRAERLEASGLRDNPMPPWHGDRSALIESLRDALHLSGVCAYAQGFALLTRASESYDYHLSSGDIARVWRGGCIIRAAVLEDILAAYAANPDLPNLLAAPRFAGTVARCRPGLAAVVHTATALGIPVPALSASLAYVDGYRSERLPTALIQAQRDYFGAHTYRRIDKDGVFHTAWGSKLLTNEER